MDLKPKSTLPVVTEYETRALAEWLHSREQMQRRPEATAKVLILAVKLARANLPWPTRQEVAQHLGVSRPLVDMVLSQRTATSHLEVVIVTTMGNVAKRPSVRRERHVKPCDDIIKVVTNAERRERTTRRNVKLTEIATPLITVLAAIGSTVCSEVFLGMTCQLMRVT